MIRFFVCPHYNLNKMLAVVLVGLTLPHQNSEAQLKKEASLMVNLSSDATWTKLKSSLPKGTKFRYEGFTADEYTFGNIVRFEGAMNGNVVLLSSAQAMGYAKWLNDPKAKNFPTFPAGGPDRIRTLQIEPDNGSFSVFDKNGNTTLLSVLEKAWGTPDKSRQEYDQEYREGWAEWTWKSRGLSFFDDGLDGSGYLKREFRLSFAPKIKEAVDVKSEKADHTAMVQALSGKTQTRLHLTSNQLFLLKGFKMKPYGWQVADYDTSLVGWAFKSEEDVPYQIKVQKIGNKRVVNLMFMAG